MQDGHPDWERQLNVYAFLVRHSKGLKVRSLSVIGVLRDWRKADADRRAGYPSAPILELDVPLWSEEEQDEFVRERIRLHRVAELEKEFSGLPECTDEERWTKPGKWAVHKGKNKRALKLFDTKEEAEAFAKETNDRRVEERRSEYVRCSNNYCRVNAWCEQWLD